MGFDFEDSTNYRDYIPSTFLDSMGLFNTVGMLNNHSENHECRGSIKSRQFDCKIFKNPDSAQEWGENNFYNWENDLSSVEKTAIMYYTSNNSTDINIALRGDSQKLPPKRIKELQKYIPYIKSALKKARVPESVLVYRSVPKNALGEYKDLPLTKLKGKVIKDKGFFATSLYPSECLRDSEIMLVIRVPEDTNGAFISGNLSAYSFELELLLKEDTLIKIIDYCSEQGQLKLLCEVV